MLSAVCETRVPSSTGNVSRIRPVRRASTMARAGSPRRAGSVADISTPIIVAEVTSRRRSGPRGSAARAIANQETARMNIEAIISAVAISTQPASERTMLATTFWSPILCAARAVRPTPSTPATPRPMRRATRWRAAACAGGGSSEGSRLGGRRGPPSIGATRSAGRDASAAVAGSGALAGLLVDPLDLARRRAARRSARPFRVPRGPSPRGGPARGRAAAAPRPAAAGRPAAPGRRRRRR